MNPNSQQQQPTQSAFGFINFAPVGRDSRRADRDFLEKKRLSERKTGFVRHDLELNPIRVEEDAAGFINDAERFHTDVSGEYKQTRDREVQRRQEIQDSKRKENLNREEARWEKIDQENQKEEEKWKNLAGTSMRNNSSVPYDLLNLRFNNGKDAQRGQYIQDSIDYLGAQRAQFLYNKTSSDGFNPITGEQLPNRVSIPQRPPNQEQFNRNISTTNNNNSNKTR